MTSYSFSTSANPPSEPQLSGLPMVSVQPVRVRNSSWDSHDIVPTHQGRSLQAGGYRNPLTGAGGFGDKSEGGLFVPNRYVARQQLETLYVQSWACRAFIDLPVDDMFIRWRTMNSMSEEQGFQFTKVEQKHRVRMQVARAMKSGRLFGTGFLVMVSKEAAMDTPLDVNQMRSGDLQRLTVFDRYHASLHYDDYDLDPTSPTYEEPLMYRFYTRYGAEWKVDASRVIRFDGITPLTDRGWESYQREWGVSEVIPVLLSIMQDVAVAGGVAHLAAEASVPVVKLSNFRDTLAGDNPDPDELTPEQMGELMTMYRSIYRTLYMDVQDEYERVNVSFAGLPDLLDRFAIRLAAAAHIPATRFWGRSPVGMNATGDSDMLNYDISVAALQTNQLTGPFLRLDEVLAKDAGVPADSVRYTWPSLMDISPETQAMNAKTKAQAVYLAKQSGEIDDNEGRAALNGDPFFGRLEPLKPEEVAKRRAARIAEKKPAGGTGGGTGKPPTGANSP